MENLDLFGSFNWRSGVLGFLRQKELIEIRFFKIDNIFCVTNWIALIWFCVLGDWFRIQTDEPKNWRACLALKKGLAYCTAPTLWQLCLNHLPSVHLQPRVLQIQKNVKISWWFSMFFPFFWRKYFILFPKIYSRHYDTKYPTHLNRI